MAFNKRTNERLHSITVKVVILREQTKVKEWQISDEEALSTQYMDPGLGMSRVNANQSCHLVPVWGGPEPHDLDPLGGRDYSSVK